MDTSQISKPLTFRLYNIPHSVTRETLILQFFHEDRENIKIKSFCPDVEDNENDRGNCTYTATIYHNPRDPYRSQPSLTDPNIEIDRDFFGFTPLYVPKEGPIVADIIAITGLAGHAYGSWSHSPEHMWLRDYLPRDAPNARIITWGYPSSLRGDESTSILADFATTFFQRLIDMRDGAKCESRPIIFIGHSLGCLVIKKALTDVTSKGILNSHRLPVRAIIFLGAPHKGLYSDSHDILRTLVKGRVTQQLVTELKSGSPTLIDLSHRFTPIAQEIKILTAYETKETRTVVEKDGRWVREGKPMMMVSQSSAVMNCANETVTAAQVDHSQLARVKKGENGIYPNIRTVIRQALLSTAKIVATNNEPNHQEPQRTESVARKRGRRGTVKRFSEEDGPPAAPHRHADEYEKQPPLEETFSGLNLNIPTTGRATATPEPVSAPPHVQGGPTAEVQPEPCGDMPPPSYSDVTSPEPDQPVECLQNDSELVRALKSADQEMLAAACRARNQLSKKGPDGYPPVCVAARWGLNNGLRTLHGKGASLESRTRDGQCPLIVAIDNQQLDTVGTLIDLGADVDAADGNGTSALHWAVFRDDDALRLLLSNDADPEATDAYGYTALMYAAKQNDLGAARILLEYRPNVNHAAPQTSITALTLAAESGYTDMCRELLDAGAYVDARQQPSQDTALALAATNEHYDVVELLLEYGATVNLTNTSGYTPLTAASEAGDVELVDLLLQYIDEADEDADDEEECGPPSAPFLSAALLLAASAGHFDVCASLLDAGADPNSPRTADGATPLALAAELGHDDVLHLLLSTAGTMHAPSGPLGLTPLIRAAQHGNASAVKALLGAVPFEAIDAPSAGGWTALSYAAAGGHVDAAALLLGSGAEIDRATDDGLTPLALAATMGHIAVVNLLLSSAAASGAAACSDPAVLGLKSWEALACAEHVTEPVRRKIVEILERNYKASRPGWRSRRFWKS